MSPTPKSFTVGTGKMLGTSTSAEIAAASAATARVCARGGDVVHALSGGVKVWSAERNLWVIVVMGTES